MFDEDTDLIRPSDIDGDWSTVGLIEVLFTIVCIIIIFHMKSFIIWFYHLIISKKNLVMKIFFHIYIK